MQITQEQLYIAIDEITETRTWLKDVASGKSEIYDFINACLTEKDRLGTALDILERIDKMQSIPNKN